MEKSGWNLSVFVGDVAEKSVGIGETLRPGAFAYTDDTVLLRMQYTALDQQNKLRNSGSILVEKR